MISNPGEFKRISVVAVDDDPNSLRTMSHILASAPQAGLMMSSMAADIRHALDTIRLIQPEVVVIDSVIKGESGMGLAHQIRTEFSHIGIVMTLDPHETDVYQAIQASGVADEVIVKGFTPEQFINCLVATWQKVQKDRPAVQIRTIGAIDPTSYRPSNFVKRSVVTFYSNKGGVGKTFTGIQTAALLAKQAGGPPLNAKIGFLDLNLMNPAVGSRLDMLRPGTNHQIRTIMDVVASIRDLTPQLLESLMMTHEPSGLKVLLAPGNILDAEEVKPEFIKKIIEVARRTFDVVFIDVNPFPKDEATWATLEEADRVYIVVTPDIDCIAANRQILQLFAPVIQGEGKVKLVINEKSADSGMTSREIADAMGGLTVAAEIPLMKELVRQATNRGQVPVLVDRGPLVQAFAHLANDIIPLKPEETKKGGLGRFFGRG